MLIAVVFATGCSRPPLEISNIQLGKSLNPDNTIAQFTTRFRPTDTVYISVLNAKAGAGTLTVKWSFGSRVVSEGSKQVSYADAAATEFHLQNTSGFPEGAYRVEILLNGTSAGTRDFKVEYPE